MATFNPQLRTPEQKLWEFIDWCLPHLKNRFEQSQKPRAIQEALEFIREKKLITYTFTISEDQINAYTKAANYTGQATLPVSIVMQSIRNCFPAIMAHYQYQAIFRHYNDTILFLGTAKERGDLLKKQNRQTKLLNDLWVYISPKGNYHHLSATAGTPTNQRWLSSPKRLDALLVDWINGDADTPLPCNITRRMAIVLGLPGTGKSFLCRRLIRLLYPEHIFKEDLPFIYYFRLRELGSLFEFIDKEKDKKETVDAGLADLQPDENHSRKKNLLTILGEYITQEAFLEKEQAVHNALQYPIPFKPFTIGKSLLILDGLDEWEIITKDKKKIIDFLNELNVCLSKQSPYIPVHCLVTSRSFLLNNDEKSALDDQEGPVCKLFENALVLELGLMEVNDQKDWLIDYQTVMGWGDSDGLTTEELKVYQDKNRFPHLQELLGTPVLLNILAILCHDSQANFQLPEHKTDLYTKLIDHLVKRDWDPTGKHPYSPTPKQLRELLQEIAYHLYQNNTFFINHADILRIQKEKIPGHTLNLRDQDSPIAVILLSYFFQETQFAGAFELAHPSFRDYLIAEALVERLKKEVVLSETGNNLLLRFHDLFGKVELSQNSEKNFIHLIQSEIKCCPLSPLYQLRNHLQHCLGNLLERDFIPDQVQGDYPLKTTLNIFQNYWLVLMCLHRSKMDRELFEWSEKDKLNFLRLYGLLKMNNPGNYLCSLDTANLDFQNMEVTYWNLSFMNLAQIKLGGIRSDFASFRYSNLISAQLNGAISIFANFEGSSLENAKLIKATLIGANLRRIESAGADFTEANLLGADLSSADLFNTNLKNTNFTNACLFNTNFKDSNWWEAIFDGRMQTESADFGLGEFGPHNLPDDEIMAQLKLNWEQRWYPEMVG